MNFDDVIGNISTCLSESEGEHIAETHNKICSNKIKYVGDSIWEDD